MPQDEGEHPGTKQREGEPHWRIEGREERRQGVEEHTPEETWKGHGTIRPEKAKTKHREKWSSQRVKDRTVKERLSWNA